MKTGIKVCDAMTERPIHVPSDMVLSQCCQMMKDYKIGALLVKDGEKLKGICTEQDIVRKVVAHNKDADKTSVSEVMDPNIRTISPEKDIFEAIMMMRNHNIRHLPVVDGEETIGLLTMKDILKIEPQLFDLLVEKIDLREEQRKPIRKYFDVDDEVESKIHG